MESNDAVIYFYAPPCGAPPTFLQKALLPPHWWEAYVDNGPALRIVDTGYDVRIIPPGKHLFTSYHSEYPDSDPWKERLPPLTLVTRPGGIYFIRPGPIWMTVPSHFFSRTFRDLRNLELVEEEMARGQIALCRRAQ